MARYALRNAVLFTTVMACAFRGRNLNFNMDNDVSHLGHGSLFRLLLGERRSDLLNKSIIIGRVVSKTTPAATMGPKPVLKPAQ
jgi:hypothetical protein